jgi:HEAT repeat protein
MSEEDSLLIATVLPDKLVLDLEASDKAIQIHAARMLGLRKDPAAVPALAAAAKKANDPQVQAAIAQALGVIDGPEALTALIRLSQTAQLQARVEAIMALGRFDDPAAIAALRGATEDVHVVVRREAGRVLTSKGFRASNRAG